MRKHIKPYHLSSAPRQQLLQGLILAGATGAMPNTQIAQSSNIAPASRGSAPVLRGLLVEIVNKYQWPYFVVIDFRSNR